MTRRDEIADELDALEESLKTRFELQLLDIQININGDIRLAHLIVPKGALRNQGRGTAVVTELCKFADRHGRRILLSPGHANKEHGTTSRRRLVLFYKRFGFVENKGRRKDFTTMEGMYRSPR